MKDFSKTEHAPLCTPGTCIFQSHAVECGVIVVERRSESRGPRFEPHWHRGFSRKTHSLTMVGDDQEKAISEKIPLQKPRWEKN